MKRIVYLLLVLFSILFVTSCWLNPDDDQEIQLLQNSDVEDGTMDWTLFSIQLNEVLPSNIKSITVYLLLLPDTSGDVYFDDITLTY